MNLRNTVIGLMQSVFGITVSPLQTVVSNNNSSIIIDPQTHSIGFRTGGYGVLYTQINNGTIIGYSNSANQLRFTEGYAGINSNVAGIFGASGGLLVVTDGSTGGGVLRFAARTAPSSAAGYAQVYSKDVTGTAELFGMDGGGTEVQLTSHRNDGPDWLYDDDDPMPRVLYEANYYTGIVRYTNASRKDRLVELQLQGKKLPTGDAARFIHTETFAEHNARLGLTDNALAVRDWDADQKAEHGRYHAGRATELAALAKWEAKPEGKGEAPTVRPDVDLRVPCPDWIAERKAARK